LLEFCDESIIFIFFQVVQQIQTSFSETVWEKVSTGNETAQNHKSGSSWVPSFPEKRPSNIIT
jgi:hypothetical protein